MALGVHRVMYTGPFVPEKWYRVLTEEQATVVTTAPAALRRWTEPLTHGGCHRVCAWWRRPANH